MSTTLVTRQTAGTGATVKGSPLTNTEVDTNFINLNNAVLPAGGTAGQVLSKIDATDFNSQWIDNYAVQLKFQAKNTTGATLNKGAVVYVSGGSGANPFISLAKADSDGTSATTVGILESTVVNNGFGLVVESGTISGIDTSAAVDGDPVWLSGSAAGGMLFGIANKPQAPIHIVYLGTVTRAHATQGEIQVKVNNGWELDELHDVQIISKTNDQVLQYEASTTLWKNKTLTTTSVGEGTNLYYTDARVRAAISGTAPVVFSSSTGAISMAAATTSVDGYLASTDWNTFNNKQAQLVSGTNIKTINSTSLLGSGDISIPVGDPAGTAVAMAIALG